jgi:hypothetical protein
MRHEFSFFYFFFSYVSCSPQKLSSACDGAHITVEYNDKGGLFFFHLCHTEYIGTIFPSRNAGL